MGEDINRTRARTAALQIAHAQVGQAMENSNKAFKQLYPNCKRMMLPILLAEMTSRIYELILSDLNDKKTSEELTKDAVFSMVEQAFEDRKR